MQDHKIVPKHFAYSLRYDLPQNDELSNGIIGLKSATVKVAFEEFNNFINYPYITHHLGAYEVAALSKKHHIQAIIWSKTKLAPNQMMKIRNKIRYKYNLSTNKGQLALASAKNIPSLSSYCTKQQLYTTNLTSKQLELLKKWKPYAEYKKTLKQDKKDELIKHLDEQDFSNICFDRFAHIFNQLYTLVYDQPCIHRATYFKYALKYNTLDEESFLERINVVKPRYSQTTESYSYKEAYDLFTKHNPKNYNLKQ